eukprot:SAG31_NODE_2174_length_6257_cov_1.750244_3_plen_87_part_00
MNSASSSQARARITRFLLHTGGLLCPGRPIRIRAKTADIASEELRVHRAGATVPVLQREAVAGAVLVTKGGGFRGAILAARQLRQA